MIGSRPSHRNPLLLCQLLRTLLLSLDVIEAALELIQGNLHLDILGIVGVQPVLDAHSVESMLAREHIELTIKNGLEAEVTHLAGVDRNMLVLLLSLLLAEKLGIVGVLHELIL